MKNLTLALSLIKEREAGESSFYEKILAHHHE
jgi:hypothetical protein